MKQPDHAKQPDQERALRSLDLLARALEASEEEREALLAASDPELAADVRRRLQQAQQRGAEFLASGPELPGATDSPPPDNADPLAQIGPYRVVKLLGEGGMGQVFLAEQEEPVRRRVAIKVLHRAVSGREARARFAAERQALARLEHPNVGKLLEAGTTEQGQPFFAMELIEGEAITTACDQHQLPLADRLRLFVGACRGVEHAHLKLLLHRDLKPSNILVTEVDDQPVAKLIDFGIAKGLTGGLSDETLITGDRLIGTLAYMSPEALAPGGEVDARSDVFSLGVVLYELLVGHRPWGEEEETLLGVSQRLRHDSSVPPSARLARLTASDRSLVAGQRRTQEAELMRSLQGDLGWIVLKAIAHRPEQRYASPADLADDIERYLVDEPVTARPPTTRYLIRKLVRRHRGRFIGAGLVAAALALAVVGTSFGLLRARTEAEQARQARDVAVLAQQDSEQLATFLQDLFGEVDSSLENPADLSARQVLERGTTALRTELVEQPRSRATLLRAVGEIYTRWDDLTTAEELLLESSRLQLEDNSKTGHVRDQVDLFTRLAELRHKQARYEDALLEIERALELVRGAPPVDLLLQAQLETRAAASLQFLNRFEEAEARLIASIENLESMPDGSTGRHDALGHAYMELGGVAHRQGDRRGLDHYRRAVELFERAHGSQSRQVVPPLNRLAYWMIEAGQQTEAEAILRRSLDLQQRLLGENTLPVARSQYLLGRVLTRTQRFAEAETAFRRSIEIRQQVGGEPHPLQANALGLLAHAIHRQADGRDDEVDELFDQADNLMVEREPIFPVFSAVMRLRAGVARDRAQLDQAELHLERAITWLEGLESAPPAYVSATYFRLAQAVMDQGRPTDAEPICARSLEFAYAADNQQLVDQRQKALAEIGC